MSKKELIQIRVLEDDKQKIKTIARKKGMTISEFTRYSLMRTISEYELLEIYYKNSQWNQGGDFKNFMSAATQIRNKNF